MKEWFKARNLWGASLLSLSDDKAGKIAKAIWTYTMYGESIPLDDSLSAMFAMMLMTLKQDEIKDAEISEKRSKATDSIRNQKASNDIKSNQMISNDSKTDQMISNDSIKNKNKSKNIEKEQEQLFDRFWSAYPRKVGKENARKAFAKVNPDESMLTIILREVERQSRSPQWTKDGGMYIPHPATWLNGKRWEDEPSPQPQGKVVVAQNYEQRDYAEVQDELARKQNERIMQAIARKGMVADGA